MKLQNIILLAVLVVLSGCKKPSEQEEGQTAIKDEIQALENRYAKAVSSKVLDSIMPYYADDAVSYDSEAKPLSGKKSIRASINNKSSAYPESEQMTFTVTEVFPSSDAEQVVEIGHYQVKDSKGIAYGSGNYFALFEKRDGKYVCIRDIQTPDTPRKVAVK
ncbi:YybH family protein [Flavobacterium silvaticum]|uniref:Nuclear transport factor 2 family protein n=1 Tax=Flavobacterium silvaticum TaxID=1852020 RepID=A0A972FSN8_9FLAO|nr:nuclear transport factor 2 family protein [Flavobacterium silvaticum]NMH27758.1 nuclear transport factor 2 family protein [Flavobacterium silvaticum]